MQLQRSFNAACRCDLWPRKSHQELYMMQIDAMHSLQTKHHSNHQANLSRPSDKLLINYEFGKVKPAGPAPEMSLGVTHFNFALCLKLISMSNCPGGQWRGCWGIIKKRSRTQRTVLWHAFVVSQVEEKTEEDHRISPKCF